MAVLLDDAIQSDFCACLVAGCTSTSSLRSCAQTFCSATLGGQSGLLLRLLLSSLTRRTAQALGVRGGGEFLAARQAAEAVEAQVGRVGTAVLPQALHVVRHVGSSMPD